jgi:hypothetical protein
MKKNILALQLVCLIAGLTLRAQNMAVDSFFCTGSTQTFVIPQCVSTLTVMLHGARGGYDTLNGGWPGGYGARVYVVMSGTPGALLYVNVGGKGHRNAGGWNGGGNGGWGVWAPGGGGGGASDIRVGGNAVSNRIFVAAGGGGGGGAHIAPHCYPTGSSYGGGGGGFSCTNWSNTSFPGCPPILGCGGEDGNSPAANATCSGGTVSGDGAPGGGGGMMSGGGTSTSTNGCVGTAGALFQGGAGGDSLCSTIYSQRGFYGAGGGGGGYYGGGGGHASGYVNSSCPVGGPGGGGSTYLDSLFVVTYSLWGGNMGAASEVGYVTFSYTPNGPGVSVAASQNSICAGSPVALTASGANSYTWLPAGNFNGGNGASVNVSPASTTQYTVQGLTSMGCLAQTVTTIYVLGNSLSVTASPAFSVCSGQALSLSVSGASTVSWSGGIQNNTPFYPLASTVYTATASNGPGCTATATAAVQVVTSPTLSVGPSFPAVCPGNTISLLASGAGSYSWSTGGTSPSIIVSPAVTTIYHVSASSSSTNCPAAGTIQVVVYPVPILTVTATKTLICASETVTVSAGGALTYTWVTAGNSTTVNPGSMVVNPAANITYSVTGTAANQCKTSGAVSVQVDPCAGIIDRLNNAHPFVFPNPSKGTFYVQPIVNSQISVYSAIGELIYSEQLKANEKKEFHISSHGIYIVQFESAYGKGWQKVVVD